MEECRTWLWSHNSFCPYGSRQAARLQHGTLPPPLWPLSAVAVPSRLGALVLEQSQELLKVCEHGLSSMQHAIPLEQSRHLALTAHSINPNRFMFCFLLETMQQTGTTWQWGKLR